MCRVKCVVEPGLIETERVVRIPTVEGHQEEVTVSRSQVEDGAVQAALIGEQDGRALVELPRESASGRWRLWVPSSQVVR
jgi:hypothetical protein